MVTALEPEATEKPEQPVCDACRTYKCKLQLPGEFPGEYLLRPGEFSERLEREGVLCILHYRDWSKNLEECKRAVGRKKADQDCNFRGVWFSDAVGFDREKMQNADFSGARFRYGTSFFNVSFGGRADFRRACFGDLALFDETTFSGEADFSGACFDDEANFALADFHGEVDFYRATFGRAARFTLATFKQEAFFDSLAKSRDQQGKPANRKVQLDFREVEFGRAKVYFREFSMAEVRFLRTDVRQLEFTNVDWPEKLRDEQEADEEVRKAPKEERNQKRRDSYDLVETLYRQLRQNYEEQRNYPDAGRFYYGEMEMRRKAKPRWQRYFFSLTALYWLSSGYGQRARQAGLWVALLFVLFAWLYSAAGLQIAGVSGIAIHSPWAAFLHAGEVLTFARERTYSAATDFGRWLSVAQTIVLPLQVALLVLAVRRSFSR